jgi:hypothetical protein
MTLSISIPISIVVISVLKDSMANIPQIRIVTFGNIRYPFNLKTTIYIGIQESLRCYQKLQLSKFSKLAL